MNESITEPLTNAAEDARAAVDETVERHPAAALLLAIGAGVIIALVVRALRPAPTAHERLARLLEELEERIRNAAEPVVRKAGELTRDGVQQGRARLDRLFHDGRHRARKLVS